MSFLQCSWYRFIFCPYTAIPILLTDIAFLYQSKTYNSDHRYTTFDYQCNSVQTTGLDSWISVAGNHYMTYIGYQAFICSHVLYQSGLCWQLLRCLNIVSSAPRQSHIQKYIWSMEETHYMEIIVKVLQGLCQPERKN